MTSSMIGIKVSSMERKEEAPKSRERSLERSPVSTSPAAVLRRSSNRPIGVLLCDSKRKKAGQCPKGASPVSSDPHFAVPTSSKVRRRSPTQSSVPVWTSGRNFDDHFPPLDRTLAAVEGREVLSSKVPTFSTNFSLRRSPKAEEIYFVGTAQEG